MLRSFAAGLCAFLLAGTLMGCGDDESSIFLERLDPDVATLTVPVGTETAVKLKLSSSPATDQFIDIKNDYKEFIEIREGKDVVDSVRIRPKDDPPQKTLTVKAVKGNDQALEITFTLRGATGLGAERSIKIRPEGI